MQNWNPLCGMLGFNLLGHVGHDIETAFPSGMKRELMNNAWIGIELLNKNLVTEIWDHGNHVNIELSSNVGQTCMEKCWARSKGREGSLDVFGEAIRFGVLAPVWIITDSNHAVIICDIGSIVARAVYPVVFSTKSARFVLFVLLPLSIGAILVIVPNALAPVISFAASIIVCTIGLPVIVEHFPSMVLRLL